MTALAWVIGLGILAYFLSKFSKFRKYFLITIVGIVGLGIIASGLYWGITYLIERNAKSMISADQVEMTELKLWAQYASSWSISGKIKNNSAHILDGLTMKITAYDCPTNLVTPECETIGEDPEVYVSVTVPSGQVRQLDRGYISLNNMPTVKNTFLWTYELTEIKGSK